MSRREIKIDSPYFRPGTQIPETKVAFAFNAGGIGDYIHYTKGIQYAIEANPFVRGYVVAPSFFIELARLWFASYRDRFRVKHSDDFMNEPALKGIPTLAPDRKQFANAVGDHPTRLGFVYYNQIDRVPAGWGVLPVIKGDEIPIDRFNLPERYAVITPYATDDTRRLTAETINEITEFLSASGITPVFLGKYAVATDHFGVAPVGLRRDDVLDLTDKTTLTEAACIMAHAKFVLGLDNGLLHLACCSLVPVVFCFTNVDPRLRLPERRNGAKTVTVVPPKELKCRYCCSNMRFIIGHDFKDCLYKDLLCTKLISGSDLIRIIKESKLCE